MNIFTYYWEGGRVSTVRAISPAAGFRALGYGGGAIAALDFQTTNGDEYWRRGREWVKREDQARLKFEGDVEELRSALTETFIKSTGVTVELENGDEVCLGRDVGEYYKVGTLHYLFLFFAERCEGGWDEEDPNDHHFMAGPSLYFHLDQEQAAIDAAVLYVQRRYRERCPEFDKAVSLEEVAERLDRGFEWDPAHCSPTSALRAQLMGGHLAQNIVQS